MAERQIITTEKSLSELKEDIENPRKSDAKGKREMLESLEQFGDFGIIVIDENNKIISGHQRVQALKAMNGEDHRVLCKQLVGYTKAEKRAINIKANTHVGTWDLSKLAAWTADLNMNIGLKLPEKDPVSELKVKEMELVRFEKYNYVMIACRTDYEYKRLLDDLGIEDAKVIISKGKSGDRKIKARAVWYDQMNVNITPKK